MFCWLHMSEILLLFYLKSSDIFSISYADKAVYLKTEQYSGENDQQLAVYGC